MGRPQQSIVWFLAEGDVVRLSLNSSRQKTDNLARNPACSLLITDPKNSYRYLELRGRAKLEPDPDYTFADKVGAKYDSDLRQNDLPGDKRVVVTIVVDRARGYPCDRSCTGFVPSSARFSSIGLAWPPWRPTPPLDPGASHLARRPGRLGPRTDARTAGPGLVLP